MSALGRCLVFHLKYAPEMKRLYWTEDAPPPAGLDKPERVMEMVKAVGDTACEDAADLLQICAKRIEEHFGAFARCKIVSRRETMERHWYTWCRVDLADIPGRKFLAGVTIYDEQRVLVPWIWCPGGTRADEGLAQILGNRIQSRAGGEFADDPGTVALAPIPILLEKHDGFDVEREPIVDGVAKAFSKITREDARAILSI